MKWQRIVPFALSVAMTFTMLSACTGESADHSDDPDITVSVTPSDDVEVTPSDDAGEQLDLDAAETVTVDEEELTLGDELIPLTASPAISTMLTTSAPGTTVYGNTKAKIDASNTQDGYIMVRYAGTDKPKLKVLVTGPSGTTYTYNLTNDGSYEAFPLSDGNGKYKVGVYRNVSGTKYSTVYSKTFTVTLTDEFAPFLRPNQYVNYTENSKCVKKAAELISSAKATTTLKKVEAVYNYVVNNFTYDRQLAATVTSGYLPDLDKVFNKKSGICFDYAATMTAMLRSQGIPCKLVVGYTGSAYHAWISTYSEETGWVDGNIYFDGNEWKLMDPTFASTGNSSSSIMQYIGNGSNYKAKYLY